MRKSKMVRMLGMDLLVSSCSSTIPALRERGELSPTALEFSSLLGFLIFIPLFLYRRGDKYIYLPSYAGIPPKLILCDFPGDGRARDCSGIVQSPFLEIFVSPFILLYLPIIISCQAASVWLPWWRKRKGRAQGSPAREWILSADQVHRQITEKGICVCLFWVLSTVKFTDNSEKKVKLVPPEETPEELSPSPCCQYY